jgi:glycosyltransferase involved in cell wall biosynthesis/aminoglycoside phosphotransferase (APT) family kinase protein
VARSTYFYTDSRVLGGAENAMFMLLASLDRAEWEPTLLLEDAAGTEPLAERAAALDVPVRRIAPLPLGLTGARRVPALARLLRRERPDVFHAHMSSPVACKWGLTAALLARVPAVLGTVQVGGYEPPDRSAYWQLRVLARGVDRYLAVSRDIAAELVERLGWPAEKVEVSYNAVDLAHVEAEAPPGLREELDGEGRPLVLTPARLDAQKGHPVLLEAIAQVPDALFLLAGEGPEREPLEALARELGIADRVRFLGRREDIPQLLATCDVFALPSLYEGSSLAVLEAMAARIPIVSSAIGGTDELIEDGRSGLLVAPGDAEALAVALRRVLGDETLRRSMATQARERVESGLTREQMATRVTGVYGELLEGSPSGAWLSFGADSATKLNHAFEDLPESRRNPAVRRTDWRFLLPDAELLAHWRLPRLGGVRRARRRFEAAGYTDVRVYWAGPLPHRLPQFWLPVDSPEAVEYLLASRGAGSLAGNALRRVWRLAHAAGLLAPLHLVGRRADGSAKEDLPLSPSAQLLLLTTGHRSINKAVGLAFERGEAKPAAAAKFARVPEAEPGLEREAQVLRQLGEERPNLAAVPRLRGEGHRAGRLAVVQGAVEGRSLLDVLSPESFEELAMRVTQVLIELARDEAAKVPPPGAKLPSRARDHVDRLLDRFERYFGSAVDPSLFAEAKTLLADLGAVPAAPEHRDCSPWNLLITPDGNPVLLDWESAEPNGLAGMDLVYFLANCAFVLDGAIESGRTRESYARLLDPATPHGRVAAQAIDAYAAALGITTDDFRRLRLLCWIVHSRSDYRHLQLESSGDPAQDALRRSPFLGLVEAELRRG